MNKNKLQYKVTCESGNSYTWNFTEHLPKENEKYYGNGIYISAECGHYNWIDCRYMKYNFRTICENWLKNWYGENLLKFEQI